MGMNIDYDWRFLGPADKLKVDMILAWRTKKSSLPHTSIFANKELNSANHGVGFDPLSFAYFSNNLWNLLACSASSFKRV